MDTVDFYRYKIKKTTNDLTFMISTGDVMEILRQELSSFGIITYKKGAIPLGEVTSERITILPKELQPGTFWKKGFVEVNFCVPDIKSSANTKRLTELEREALKVRKVGIFDNTSYRYSAYTTSQEEDTALKCHFVNLKILFETLNTN